MFSSVVVIISKNPVYSLLFLVLVFCNVSALLFLLRLEFLPLLLLVVYIGAIVVLFLFVVMMLNIKFVELKRDYEGFWSLLSILTIVFFSELLLAFRSLSLPLTYSLSSNFLLAEYSSPSLHYLTSSLSFFVENDIRAIGRVIFIEYCYPFVTSGFILLLAMVAAITLTLYKSFTYKTQTVYFQILRDFDLNIVHYS